MSGDRKQDSPATAASSTRSQFAIVLVVTLVRMPLAVLFAFVLLNDDSGPITVWSLVGLLTIIEISDGLDGFLARRWGVTSRMGAIVDPYSDSISRMTIYWALAAAGKTLVYMPLVFAIRDVTVAYCRILWVGANRSAGAQWSGKVKAVVQGVGAFTLILWPTLLPGHAWIEPVMSWIVLVTTVASMADYVGKTVPLLKSA
ncbi:MAG: CDP-alcohol phosphatidyltransferase family protein [Pirellulales bacterium]